MDSKDKQLNAKAQEAEDRKNYISDEEYAEKIYDDNAPTPPQFKEEHEISNTGQDLSQ